MYRLIFFLLLMYSPRSFSQQLIIWNVGQGQWISEVDENICIHYDLGGEINIIKNVLSYCQKKLNILFISHWDWDHISWAPRFSAKIKSACLYSLPAGNPKNWKKDFLKQIPSCSQKDLDRAKNYTRSLYEPQEQNRGKRARPNDLSRVFESIQYQVLIPGDSTKTQEFQWQKNVSSVTQGLVLGHHGSQTSTSKSLLDQLPHLKWAVASARRKKYGHPHGKVIHLLKQRRIPLLRTEDWGHLHYLRN